MSLLIKDIPKCQTGDDYTDLNLYEIYTYNEEDITEGCYKGKKAGEVTGWNIFWVLSTDEKIKTFPLFDCIITKNDYGMIDRSIGAYIWK